MGMWLSVLELDGDFGLLVFFFGFMEMLFVWIFPSHPHLFPPLPTLTAHTFSPLIHTTPASFSDPSAFGIPFPKMSVLSL